MKRISPALVLAILPVLTSEFLTGSTPLITFIANPVLIVLELALYGGFAILTWELTRRWGKGWPTVFIFGLIFGIVLEGLALKTFFDPHSSQILTSYGSYGRLWGVNWVWDFQTAIGDGLYAIVIPILLVKLMFPERQRESLVSKKSFWLWMGLSLASFGFMAKFTNTYNISNPIYFLTLLLIGLLFAAARYAPKSPFEQKDGRILHSFWYWLIGLGFTFAFYFINKPLKENNAPFVFAILSIFGLACLAVFIISRLSGGGKNLSSMNQLALATGALTIWIVYSFFNPAQTPVAVALILLLLWLFRKIKHSQNNLSPDAESPP